MEAVGIDLGRLAPGRLAAAEARLTPSEHGVLERQRPGHRDTWVAGRLALKLAAASAAGKPWYDVETGHRPGGAPQVTGCPEACCSLSHSGHLVVAVVGAAPVGVDVERIRPRRSALLRRVASDAEIAVLGAEDGAGSMLTRIWTIKEAALKSGGWGLSIPPRAARIRRRAGPRRVDVAVRWQGVEADVTVETTLLCGFFLSIASHEPHPPGAIRWNPELRLRAG